MRGGVWRGAVVGKSGSLLCIVLLMAGWEFNKIHIVDFRDTHLTDIWLFENRKPESLVIWLEVYFGKANVRESSLQALKRFGIFSPKCCVPNHKLFARTIATFSKLVGGRGGGGCPRPSSPNQYAYRPMVILIKCLLTAAKTWAVFRTSFNVWQGSAAKKLVEKNLVCLEASSRCSTLDDWTNK